MDSLLCLYKCEKGGAERLRIHEMGMGIGIGIGIGMGPGILCPEAQDTASCIRDAARDP